METVLNEKMKIVLILAGAAGVIGIIAAIFAFYLTWKLKSYKE